MQNTTGCSYRCLFFFWRFTVCVQVDSAGAAVTHSIYSIFTSHCSVFVSAMLFHCLIKAAYCWEKCIHTDRSRVLGPCFSFFFLFLFCYLHSVWLPVAARWGTWRGKIACPSPIESAVVCCQLSPVCWGNRQVVTLRFLSDVLIRQAGSPTLDPGAEGFPFRQRPPSFIFFCSSYF